ncbi:MAG: hypothetical protein ACREDU_05730, partial [Methylocella sp.]
GYKPLTDFKGEKYIGYEGGLYPGRTNQPSPSYLQLGLKKAAAVKPRNRDGTPDSAGRIALLSIGMSNTTAEFSEFVREAGADPQRNPQVVLVDGAQGGMDAERTKDPGSSYWNFVAQRLSAADVTASQVQVVWLKQAIAGENKPFPADARQLQDDLRANVRILIQRFPNLQLIYLSSRIYAGYASTRLNPEPHAYQSGFAVKWFIEEAIRDAGNTNGPWIAWGPYLWTDGTKGRKDGLVWTCNDVRQDGTHPSPTGTQKVAGLLLRFFRTDPTANPWYMK